MRYVMKQKLWSIGDDFTIQDEQGQDRFFVDGKALIDYGFRVWNLDRIIAQTSYDNGASMAVMRRAGMRIERNPNPEPEWFQVVGVIDHP